MILQFNQLFIRKMTGKETKLFNPRPAKVEKMMSS